MTQPQATDDEIWADFLGWLRGAPGLNGPRDVFQGHQQSIAAAGVPPAEVERRFNTVLRLMRERTEAWPLMFDRIYASATPSFNTQPNALLVAAIEGRPPGRALEIGVGQGRNAIALAARGWKVTGFDISPEGLASARAQAARAGVELDLVQQSGQEFDLGSDAWDLVAIIYGPGNVADPGYVERLRRSLRAGGLVVIESFASDRRAARRKPVDIDPGELLAAFADFRILRFEDVDGVSEWDPQPTELVRLVAQRKE